MKKCEEETLTVHLFLLAIEMAPCTSQYIVLKNISEAIFNKLLVVCSWVILVSRSVAFSWN